MTSDKSHPNTHHLMWMTGPIDVCCVELKQSSVFMMPLIELAQPRPFTVQENRLNQWSSFGERFKIYTQNTIRLLQSHFLLFVLEGSLSYNFCFEAKKLDVQKFEFEHGWHQFNKTHKGKLLCFNDSRVFLIARRRKKKKKKTMEKC
ncbi:hypothetical protein Syun_030299 [Stephania yunnanensis]|uniref:Uncharacterized protein n=1 Tax=Stephania yunnanensis TaxID=152371 RepID=A0AAP0E9K1_9MAGN